MSSITKIKVGNTTYNIKDNISGYITSADLTNKQDTFQYSTMPTASSSYSGKIIQYTGVTDSNYVNGYFYKCVNNGSAYSWTRASVQPGAQGSMVTDVLNNGVSVVSNQVAILNIPDSTSDLTNDSGFITSSYHDSTKQDTLIGTQTTGQNIKTINNVSLLGEGNITIQSGGGGTTDYDQLNNRPQINNITLTGNKSLDDLNIQSKITNSNKLAYSLLSNTPTIPTQTSQLVNNSGFITSIPNANSTTVGGLKIYYNSSTQYLYITNDGSSPIPS